MSMSSKKNPRKRTRARERRISSRPGRNPHVAGHLSDEHQPVRNCRLHLCGTSSRRRHHLPGGPARTDRRVGGGHPVGHDRPRPDVGLGCRDRLAAAAVEEPATVRRASASGIRCRSGGPQRARQASAGDTLRAISGLSKAAGPRRLPDDRCGQAPATAHAAP